MNVALIPKTKTVKKTPRTKTGDVTLGAATAKLKSQVTTEVPLAAAIQPLYPTEFRRVAI